MVACHLAKGALRSSRVLSSTGGSGLRDALTAEATSGPWTLRSIDAFRTFGSSFTPTKEASTTAPTETPAPAEQPSPSSSFSSQTAAASSRPKVPEGHVDFDRKELVMMFTCGRCEVRSVKAFSKAAYTSGVVLVECSGCGVKHLIADHLGWFGTKGNVEDFAAERGQTVVTRLADNTLELTPEDLVGPVAAAAMKDAATAAAAAAAAAGNEKAA